jgi:two-component sensor histidine kinase
LATQAGGVGVYDTDVARGVTRISPELSTILGMPGATEISVEDGLALVDPRDRQELADRIADSMVGPGDGVLAIDMRLKRPDNSVRWVSLRGRTYFQEVEGERKAIRSIGAVFDITERKQWESTQRLLLSELNHRIKNTLTTVQAIASQTLRSTRDPQTFAASFNGRLQALAQAHALLTQSSWDGAYLDDIMKSQLGDADPGQVSRSGPRVFLPPQIALHVALTLHELATNARKYGALSTEQGHLELSWTVQHNDEDALDFHWLESGGPPVAEPTHAGFGTKLIRQSLSGLGGNIHLDFASTGVSCHLHLPIGAGQDPQGNAPDKHMS